MKNAIYLDYNATCPIRPEIIELVSSVMTEGGNPSSVHAHGRKARGRVEDARRQISKLIDCKPQEIIFTSGGTEANNMALNAVKGCTVMTALGEHDSVLAPANLNNVRDIACRPNGLIDLEDLKTALEAAQTQSFVSIMLANNETGVCQPIAEIAELVHSLGGLLHTDAIQAVGKIPVSFRDMGVDMMSVSGHKIGGPQGQGTLVVREGLVIKPGQIGGGQELGRRGGTENVAGIAGFGLAAEMAGADLHRYLSVEDLRNTMEAELSDFCSGAVIYGANSTRLPNTSCLSMPGVTAELQVMNFDLAGIAISAGSACSSGKVKASHVLVAMGANEIEAGEAIRVSLGRETTRAEIDRFVEVWKKLYEKKSPRFAA